MVKVFDMILRGGLIPFGVKNLRRVHFLQKKQPSKATVNGCELPVVPSSKVIWDTLTVPMVKKSTLICQIGNVCVVCVVPVCGYSSIPNAQQRGSKKRGV